MQVVDVSDNPLGGVGAVALLSELAAAAPASVQALHLSGTACGSGPGDTCSAIAAALARGAACGLRSLQALSLGGNGIGADGAAALARPLAGLPALERLDLSGNAVGDRGVSTLLREIQEAGAAVREVVVRECGAAEAALQARAPAHVTLVWT